MTKIHKFLLRLFSSFGFSAYKGIHGTKHEYGVQIVEQQIINPSGQGFFGTGAYFWLHTEGSELAYLLAKDWWWQAHCGGSRTLEEKDGKKAFFPVLATLKVRSSKVLDLTHGDVSRAFDETVAAQLEIKYPGYQNKNMKDKDALFAEVATSVVETLSKYQNVSPAVLIASVRPPAAKWRRKYSAVDYITGNGKPCIVVKNQKELIEYNLVGMKSAA